MPRADGGYRTRRVLPERSQLDVFAARDEAIERVDRNADPEWKRQALAVVQRLAQQRAEFISEDAWPYLPPVREPRALGGIMRTAQARGWIEPTDRVVPSPSKVGHGRPSRVWRSRLYPGREHPPEKP